MVKIRRLKRDGFIVYKCGICGGVYEEKNKNMARYCCEDRKGMLKELRLDTEKWFKKMDKELKRSKI